MGNFHRIDTSKLFRSPARVLWAATGNTPGKPAKISDVILTTAGTTQYDPVSGWNDLGSTQDGCQVEINNTEDAYDVDQIQGAVATYPNAWEMFVNFKLAESTMEHWQYAWEGSAITSDLTTTPNEREIGFAGATAYTERRLAVIGMRPTGKLVGMFFHRTVRTPQQGVWDWRKSGTNLQAQVRLMVLADASEPPLTQHVRIREQL